MQMHETGLAEALLFGLSTRLANCKMWISLPPADWFHAWCIYLFLFSYTEFSLHSTADFANP